MLFDKKNTPLVFTAGANAFNKPKLQETAFAYLLFAVRARKFQNLGFDKKHRQLS
jgi:hypothetical protein